MKTKIVIVILMIMLPKVLVCQSDTSSVSQNELVKNPNFLGVQFEAVSAIVTNEIGISGDYDFYSSANKKYNIGLRISTELYEILDLNVGGGHSYGPYLDVSILGRHSIRGRNIWFSALFGTSLHNNFEENKSNTVFLIKGGLELRYNFYKENIGIVLKYVSGFVEKSGYGGIGLTIGFYSD